MSMSQDFVRSGLLPSGPCPATILLGVIVNERESFLGGGNHAVDTAARTGVDVAIHAVEKQVAEQNMLGTPKKRRPKMRRLFRIKLNVGL